ncbi:hypothetical protein ACW5R3_04715 [Bizionia sp. KMM 8389]
MSRFYVLFICLLTLIFSSCNFTEEITFKPDGSGEFIMHYDMSEVMGMLKEMGGESSEDENKEKQKLDSVVYFKDLLSEKADSISQLPQAEQDKLKDLKDIIIKIKMDEETGAFDFGFGSTFSSLDSLPQALENIDKAKQFNSKDNQQFSKLETSAVAKSAKNMLNYLDYSYDGKRFSRKLKDDYKKSKADSDALKAEIESMGADSRETFESMTYTLVYSFPKPIKKVSNKKAIISKDRKTLRLTLNFLEMFKSPESMNLHVVLKD